MSERLQGLTVVIPALNEEATIGQVVTAALEAGERVLVVDDGSTDGTGAMAQMAGASVLRHEKPGGYDGAIADGINTAFREGAQAVITVDADGQHRIEDLRRIALPVLAGEVLYCGGVRDHYNRPVEAMLGLIARPLYGTNDPFCGLKCYHSGLFHRCGSFPAALHVGTLPLVWLRRLRLPHRFVPIHVRPREDRPRFGSLMQASLKLLGAFLALLCADALYPKSSRRA